MRQPLLSAAYDLHHLRGVTPTLQCSVRKCLFDLPEVPFVQLDVNGPNILFEARHATRAWDRNNVLMAAQKQC